MTQVPFKIQIPHFASMKASAFWRTFVSPLSKAIGQRQRLVLTVESYVPQPRNAEGPRMTHESWTKNCLNNHRSFRVLYPCQKVEFR